ncbi:dynein light chain Tctex-type 5-like [Ostrinia nubilalis]|uniref:dynein light chain Tctex-type 5-like n=1 Tax=Ostrinia nubilalis TaxID=29057 RepID=UPI0030822FC4
MSQAEIAKSKTSMMGVKSQPSVKSVTTFGQKSMSRLKVRRASFGYSGVPGIRPVERTSQLGIEFKRPPMLFLNTFQLEPKPKFHIAQVKAVVEEMLDSNFTGHKYNVQESTGLTIRLANELMRKIKTMGFNRHRIITIVTIGQKRAQSYNNALAFVWDHERDSYVNTQREVSSAFIQVTVLAVYLD